MDGATLTLVLFLGACLLMHLFMHRGHRRHAVRVEAHGEEGDDSADVRMNEP